jgi:fibronectin type 3 domain-containing protein
VELNWYAPDSSPSAVVGYNVYRAPDGESSYQLLNSSVESETDYVDSTVKSGLSYDYIVKSVDAFGVESAPSNIANVTIP